MCELFTVVSMSFLCRYGHHPYREKSHHVAKSLRAVRLNFGNGFATEKYPQEEINPQFDKETTIKFNQSKKIAKISMGISICNTIIALRVYDDSGEMFIDTNWWDKRGHNPFIEVVHKGSYEADLKEW